MDRPDLDALVAYWQQQLRVQDWRIAVGYVRDLVNSDGDAVYGLCSRLVDNKTATIKIRDPETPVPGISPSIEEIIIHEISHLLAAPLTGDSPAAVAAEEQMVWAFSEALIRAKGSPREAQVTRAMLASVTRRQAAPKGNATMDPKIVAAAVAAMKSGDGEAALAMLEKMLIEAASGGAAPPEPGDGGEGAPPPDAPEAKTPPPPPPAPAADDKTKPAGDAPAKKEEPMQAKPMAAKALPQDPVVAMLAEQVQQLTQERSARAAKELADERAQLASKPGLAPELVAIVRDMKTPIETARSIASVAKAAEVAPTRGAGQTGERSARLAPAENAELKRKMGTSAGTTPRTQREGNKLIFNIGGTPATKGV